MAHHFPKFSLSRFMFFAINFLCSLLAIKWLTSFDLFLNFQGGLTTVYKSQYVFLNWWKMCDGCGYNFFPGKTEFSKTNWIQYMWVILIIYKEMVCILCRPFFHSKLYQKLHRTQIISTNCQVTPGSPQIKQNDWRP